MPNGATHHSYHKILAIPVVASSTVAAVGVAAWMMQDGNTRAAGYVLELWFWLNAWYFAGRWLDPDLDIMGVSAAEGRATRELGLFGVFFFGYSSFYAAFMQWLGRKLGVKGLFGAHRSWLTHSPIGTLIRIFFINMPLLYSMQIVKISMSYIGYTVVFDQMEIYIFLLGQIVGLGLADGIHVILDVFEKEPNVKE